MIIFYIKEAFRAIRRAKSSFVLSLISTSISVLLIIASFMIIDISQGIERRLKNDVNVSVFIKQSVDGTKINDLKEMIISKPYVENVIYFSKENAAEKFIRETGEDFRRILSYNPLPASLSITIKDEFITQDAISGIIKELSSFDGVDEVVFAQEFVYKLLRYLERIQNYVFIITAVLFLISLYIVYSTLKLIIGAKAEEIETMKLVGSKLSTIKAPVIFNGIIIGSLASIISIVIYLLFVYYSAEFIGLRTLMGQTVRNYLIGAALIGPMEGFIISAFVVRKISLRVSDNI